MEWINNLKISHKLLVLITLSLFFVSVVGVIGCIETRKTGTELTNIYKNCLEPIRDISQIVINSNSNNALLLSILTTNSQAKRLSYNQQLQTTRKENTKLLEAYESTLLTPEEKSILEESGKNRKLYSKVRDDVIKLALAGKTAEGTQLYHSQLTIAYKPYAEGLKKLLLFKSSQAEEIHSKVEKNTATANLILLITIFSAFGFQISLSLRISKMINDPINRVVADLNEGATQVSAASEQLSNASQIWLPALLNKLLQSKKHLQLLKKRRRWFNKIMKTQNMLHHLLRMQKKQQWKAILQLKK